MKMKKILKFLTAVLLMFTLTGCASSQSYEELMALGSKAIAAENYEEAVTDYSKAIEIDPSRRMLISSWPMHTTCLMTRRTRLQHGAP